MTAPTTPATPNVHSTAPFIVSEFAKNHRERVRASLQHFGGRALIDLRVWVPRRSDGALVPGPKGLTLDRTLLPDLEHAVHALRTAAASTTDDTTATTPATIPTTDDPAPTGLPRVAVCPVSTTDGR